MLELNKLDLITHSNKLRNNLHIGCKKLQSQGQVQFPGNAKFGPSEFPGFCQFVRSELEAQFPVEAERRARPVIRVEDNLSSAHLLRPGDRRFCHPASDLFSPGVLRDSHFGDFGLPPHQGALELVFSLCHDDGPKSLCVEMLNQKVAVSLRILFILALSLAFINCASAPREKSTLPKERDPQYQYELAQTALRYGLQDEAIRYLNQATTLDPNHYPSFFLMGVIQSQKRNFLEAEKALRSCLELKPDHGEAHLRLGIVLEQMLEPDKAEEEYKKAYAINGSVEALINLAKLYYDQKKLEQSLETIQEVTQKDGGSLAAFNLEGVVLNQLGRYPEAVSSFQTALRIDPQSDVARINLAVALINTGNFKEARELLEKTLERVKDQNLKERILEYLKKIEGLEPARS